MYRKVFCLIFIFYIAVTSLEVIAFEQVTDKQIKSLLERLEFESEQKFKNFSLRVFSAREDGECDGSPTTCPRMSFYLIVSTLEEYPERSVYLLPKSYGWELLGVEEVDLYGEFQKHLVVSLNKNVVSNDISQGWWSKDPYKIKISPWIFQEVKNTKRNN